MEYQEKDMGKEEEQHTCNFCGKRFKNVRALCGHKRSHSSVIQSANKGVKKLEFQLGIEEIHQKSLEFGENSEKKSGYKFFCQKCDKGFVYFRAFHRHMRLHSKREIGLKKDLKFNTPREKRSKRRYKVNTTSINYSFCSNLNNFGTRLSVSIVDEEELMEIASCLLMLAKGGFYFADDVSHVSVESEMIAQGEIDVVEPSCSDNNAVIKGVKFDDLGANLDDLKSGYISVEQNAKVLGFNHDVSTIRQVNVECRPNSSFEHESQMYVTKIKDEITGIPQEGLIFGSVLESKTCDHALEECKCEVTGVNLNTFGQTHANNSMLKHICKFCEKGFQSGQSLGGHRLHCPPSKRSRISESAMQFKPVDSQKSWSKSVKLKKSVSEIDTHFKPVASKKSGHQNVTLGGVHGKKRARNKICLVCSKTFGSGQALGGHMRTHFQGNPQSCETKTESFDHEISGQTVSGKMMARLLGNPQSCEANNDAFEHEIPEAALVPVA